MSKSQSRAGKDIDKRVGERVTAIRASLTISSEHLAVQANVAPELVAAIESGTTRAGAEILLEFGRILGVNPSQFFAEDSYGLFAPATFIETDSPEET